MERLAAETQELLSLGRRFREVSVRDDPVVHAGAPPHLSQPRSCAGLPLRLPAQQQFQHQFLLDNHDKPR